MRSVLPDTDQVTDQVTAPVRRLLSLLAKGPTTAAEIMKSLYMTHRPTLRDNYLRPALDANLIEMTIPDKPNSRLQKYRLTTAGRQVLDSRTNGS